MTITEPSTTITDYVLAVVAAVAALKLARNNDTRKHWSVRFWVGALGFTGVAAATGGTYHGFQSVLGGPSMALVWKTTMLLCFRGSGEKDSSDNHHYPAYRVRSVGGVAR
jgi:hypothetical protein